MNDFIDYYEEFHLKRTASCDEIRSELGALETDYLKQRAVCITASQLAVIQELLNRIGDAIFHLANQDRRKKYDRKLEKMASSGLLGSQQTMAMDDYGRAVEYENKGRAAEAIMFAERAIKNNIYSMDAYALMIRCCYQIGEYQKALDVAENTAIKMYPGEVSFKQYAARIRTLHGDYKGAEYHIQDMLKKFNDDPAGHIEDAVKLLYMSKDRNFSESEKRQAELDAKNLIDSYLLDNGADVVFRSKIATALVGLSERYYSEYEGVNCRVISTKEDYEAIRALHDWAGQISSDSDIQDAVAQVVELEEKKYNSDNTKSLVYLAFYSAFVLMVFPALFVSTSDLGEFLAGLTGMLPAVLFFVVPFFALLKVSFRPQWMVDRIRYTGIIDPLERFMIHYGNFFIWAVKKSFEFTVKLIQFIITIASKW